MPIRKNPLVNGYVYHVFNRGIDGRKTYIDKKSWQRMELCLWYYRFSNPRYKLSKYLEFHAESQFRLIQELNEDTVKVDVLAYCLMGNHFHLLVRQAENGGISSYCGLVQNSYTRYFNTRSVRVGALFLNQFKAVRVRTDEQLMHVSRYIHLNPFTAGVVRNFDELTRYTWSSLGVYLGLRPDVRMWIAKQEVLGMFADVGDYKLFLKERADYQRELAILGKLIMD